MAAETNIFPNLLRILATKIKNAQRGQKGLRPVHYFPTSGESFPAESAL